MPRQFQALSGIQFLASSPSGVSRVWSAPALPLMQEETVENKASAPERFSVAQSMWLFVRTNPLADWHDRLGNATLSDAVMDRIIHNAYRLELSGESMRKRRSPLTYSGHKEV